MRGVVHGVMSQLALGLVVLAMACSSSSSGPAGTAGAGGSGASGGTGGAPLGPPYTGPPGAMVDPTPTPLPASWPNELTYVALAYDSTRGKVVFVPHQIAETTTELWDWDGSSGSFAQRTPSALPSDWPMAQSGYCVAYDPARQVMVLYGGVSGIPQDVATLEINLGTGEFRNVSPQSPAFDWPPEGKLMFYDATLGGVVLYSDKRLLLWDPTADTWQDSTPITLPAGVAILGPWSYDAGRRKAYAFDLYQSPVRVAELDVATGVWKSRTPASFPPDWPQSGELRGAAYDSTRDRVVLFGAADAVSPATFEWDPVSGGMTRIPVSDPKQMPDTGNGVFDEKSGHVTAIGAQPGPDGYLSDVLTWDGATWKRWRPSHIEQRWPTGPDSGAATYDSPYALTYDSSRKRTVAFVHTRTTEPMGATLEWDGSTWTDRTPPGATSSPPARFGFHLAYDASRARVVLFGGFDPKLGPFDDLWEWDGNSGTWENRTPSPLPAKWPSAESDDVLSFDPMTHRVLLVKGEDSAPWYWDGSTGVWSHEVSTLLGPSPTLSWFSRALAYDERLGMEVLLLGSGNDSTEAWSFERPTWSWRSFGTVQAPEIASLGAAYDRVRGTFVVPGSTGVGTALFAFDAKTGQFADETPATLPASWPKSLPDAIGGVAYDADRETAVILFRNDRLVERPSR